MNSKFWTILEFLLHVAAALLLAFISLGLLAIKPQK